MGLGAPCSDCKNTVTKGLRTAAEIRIVRASSGEKRGFRDWGLPGKNFYKRRVYRQKLKRTMRDSRGREAADRSGTEGLLVAAGSGFVGVV